MLTIVDVGMCINLKDGIALLLLEHLKTWSNQYTKQIVKYSI